MRKMQTKPILQQILRTWQARKIKLEAKTTKTTKHLHTWSSAYATKGHAPICVVSSSCASKMTCFWPGRRKESFCSDGGIPVTGSNLAFNIDRDHEGVIRFSEEDEAEVTNNGTSRAEDIIVADGDD